MDLRVTLASACTDVVGKSVVGIGGYMHSPDAASRIVVVIALASLIRAGSDVSVLAIRLDKLRRMILASTRADMSREMVW